MPEYVLFGLIFVNFFPLKILPKKYPPISVDTQIKIVNNVILLSILLPYKIVKLLTLLQKYRLKWLIILKIILNYSINIFLKSWWILWEFDNKLDIMNKKVSNYFLKI